MTVPSWLRWLFVANYCGLVFFLSHQPAIPIPPAIEHQDKIFHFLAYFVLGALVAFALPSEGRRRWFWAALFASVYGISDEFHQSFVPGRETEFLDWLADTIGGFCGAWIMVRLATLNRLLPFSIHR